MKKVIAGLLVVAMVFCTVAPAQAEAAKDKSGGGLEGFITGCCFGGRVAADYNAEGIGERDFASWFLVGCCLGVRTQADYADGKAIHWRDWTPLIPYVGIIFRLWDGIDGANGTTRADYVEQYGSTYY